MMEVAIELPLERGEALLLRRVLRASETILRNDPVTRGLLTEARLFAADELSNIAERLEGLMLGKIT
jgi:hypothetical protein